MSISSVRTIKLSKKYNDKTVLYDLSINLPSNGIFGILGKNGAGKTTLLAMLMGLITPTSGEIFIFEKSLRYEKYEILKNINFQSPYIELPKKMTVLQNLIFYARLYDVNDFKSKIKDSINPYGNGGGSEKIVKIIEGYNLNDILKKNFYNIPQ